MTRTVQGLATLAGAAIVIYCAGMDSGAVWQPEEVRAPVGSGWFGATVDNVEHRSDIGGPRW
ncbi:hypothetical protein GCM10023319_02170 [Nocardia iowensis]